MRRWLFLALALAGCGDDGVHHLGDAPPPPDASLIDAPAIDGMPDAMVTPAYELTSGGATVHGTRFSADVQIGHAISQTPATGATKRFEGNAAVKP